jgi:hypothetical protein
MPKRTHAKLSSDRRVRSTLEARAARWNSKNMRAVVLTLGCAVALVSADVVECQNGDRYNGKVLLVDEHNVKLQNEITGIVTIPRAKVSTISFGQAMAKPAAVVGAAKTNALPASVIEQVQNQFLSDATPEANQMFQEMVRDLVNGKIGVEELRAKAQNTLKELNDVQKDLGDDETAALLGGYASILENFLKAGQAAPKPVAPKTESP